MTHQKQELHMAGMFVNRLGHIQYFSQRTFYACCLPSFISFGEELQKRRYVQTLTNQRQELPVAAMFVNGSNLNGQSLQRNLYICCLPSFGSFGQAVSEEKNTKIDPSETRITYGGHVFNGLGQNEQTLYLLPTKFISFGEAVLEEKIFSDID